MATKKTMESPEFMYLSLESITVEEQIRSGIDMESDSFKALMESIKDRGVLEPVLVTPKDGKYLLLCGERRYLATQKLGSESIPARIINTVTQKDEILAYQLVENLQREDLNPIDQAKGILAYIQAKNPDPRQDHSRAGNGYDLDGVMNELLNIMRRPDSVSEEIAATFAAILEISGKSIRTLFNGLSLLKLPPEIQAEIRSGNLPLSQGYLFAANMECPDRMKIFTDILKTPVTYIALERMLTAYKKVKPDPVNTKPIPVKKQVKEILSIKTIFEKGLGTYVREDVEKLLYELQVFCDYVQQQAPMIPYGKKRLPQV
ncbi:MAG: ParB/RepB/Spo0J family partition protein [Proteobacteria bacterium]|nr:ParB/RepB/Spo0J family partition protein [Pseudomonadota bacterium]